MIGNAYVLCAIITYLAIAMFVAVKDLDLNLCPKYFYNKGLNWFGSWFVFIFILLFNPIGLGVRVVYFIFKGIKWLFTVGR